MWESLLSHLLVASYVIILALVAFYGFHRYVLVYLYLKHRHDGYVPKANFSELPRVTVQLPMFNEDTVAERIIRASCAIDYPLDRLEIQVLDDSTDHSADIARKACEEFAAKGFPIVYLHRDNREGYKAGALAEGLKSATGSSSRSSTRISSRPRTSSTTRLTTSPSRRSAWCRCAGTTSTARRRCSPARRRFSSTATSSLSTPPATAPGGSCTSTARPACGAARPIDDGGGWQHDTLTEDLDLSYRCQLKGWQFVYLPQFSAPRELPPEMVAFKQQAHRWTKGSMQTGIKLLPRILRSHLPKSVKWEAWFHLTNTIVYPLMVILTILMYPTFFNVFSPFKEKSWSQYIFSFSLFVLATCSASTFFAFGQRELFGKQAGWKSLLYMPVLMALGVGVSINNAAAVFEAFWSSFTKKTSEFVRTPKYGVTGSGRARMKRESMFTMKRLMLPILEIAFGCYMASCLWISFWYQCGILPGSDKSGWASVPFLLIFAGGYFYVGFSTLHALWQMSQEQEEEVSEIYEIPA
jgi:cellulose synthase/poly-beta-1,6-N-acetylglucosamine synthase-like glycosyltransferase